MAWIGDGFVLKHITIVCPFCWTSFDKSRNTDQTLIRSAPFACKHVVLSKQYIIGEKHPDILKMFFFSIHSKVWTRQLVKLWYLNPLVTNGIFHPLYLDESTFIFRGIGSNV